MTFRELGLTQSILKALAELGYEKPSPIQEKAIPPALAGRDVLGCAQTGTGKTCAFAAPILQRLGGDIPAGRPIRSLILTPTRELALQIQESFEAYGKHLPLRSAVIFGGVGQQPQVDKLKKGVDILVATPGRLLDLQGQGFVDLSRLEIFVLDEADRMLDMGFLHDVRRVLKLLPAVKQTLFFSATMPPEVMDLVNGLLKNPVKVAVDPVSSPVEIIDQSVYLVDKGNKTKLLAWLVEGLDVKNAIVFTRTKHGANKVAGDLVKAGITAAAIHGNKSQTARQQALADFKAGKVRCLVATDIAARGLDIEELSHVFNYNLPEVPETYVHRIGRTGRAGRGGTAVSFCDFGEQEYLKDIEKLIGRKVPVARNNPWPMEVFEASRDAKGRPVNADDAEARAAAKERRRARDAANKAAAEARKAKQQAVSAPVEEPVPAHEAAEAPAKKRRRRKKKSGQSQAPEQAAPVAVQTPAPVEAPEQPKKKSRRGVRQQRLEDTMPAAPSQPQTDFYKPNPLDGDVILDATARLLAPKPRTLSRPTAPRREEDRKAPRKKKAQAQPKQEKKAKEQAPAKPKKEKKAEKPAPRQEQPRDSGRREEKKHRSRSRRNGPPDMMFRRDNQKDSTEQPSLMKPYYMTPDD
ncbi:DEAD/DEAH box helicase [Pseudoflavonifractor capillosus ATCC 29799]|uniref:ATP-dependent RNA helicase CshA n=1 Tax=Pseudoflavonifractor capillosus ATCC 29799 TaxID=411467 RepID=A6NQG8_9FIRM|nr:DEAD/DEAH box helicase [Pseudoflavonifractor capillosus]EDN01772.1 DEAD/DEAH box helicase [Pseudoflavonifractor capillosus ATCC 29799]